MKKQTVVVIKYLFASLVAIVSSYYFGMFLAEEAGTKKGFYLSLFALTLIPISLFWWKFSKDGKLHPEFKKVFWGYSFALIFFVSIFSDLWSGIEFENKRVYLAIDFTFSTIFILLFIFIVLKKYSEIESKDLEIKNEKELTDSKPFHLNALCYLHELLDTGVMGESKLEFKVVESEVRLLESRNICKIEHSHTGYWVIIITPENWANINKKINIPDFLEADFSNKEIVEFFAQKLFKS